MFYYALNVIWPTAISVFFTSEATDYKYKIVLTLPQNLGLVTGAMALTIFGSKIGHWRWTLTGSVTMMVVFGALMALGTPDRKGMVSSSLVECPCNGNKKYSRSFRARKLMLVDCSAKWIIDR